MEAHLMEWLNLSVRWVHMITGVAWIGASFYFVWLENNLNRVNPKDGLAGDLWAIHGGGIYHLEKYKLAPPTMPDNLHWFKWEAYFTWMSGIALLCVVFYANPTLYLLAPGSSLSGPEGVLLGLGSLLAGWFIYSFLCDSALGKRPALLGLILFVLLIAAAYGFSKVFSGRGAYLHVGAVIGTIMVGNVFRIIMPAQRALVAAIAENRTPDPALPAKGLLRSRHNNYFTLPVLFIMISNHFPSTYGSQYNWLILAGIAVAAVLVRHYFNTRHNSQKYAWTLPVGALAMICLAYVTGPKPVATAPEVAKAPAAIEYQPLPETALGGGLKPAAPAAPAPAPAEAAPAQASIDFDKVHGVIQERCAVCHSAKPTSPLFSTAPAGVMFDTPQQIQQMAPRIQAQAVASQIMPLGNITQMTQQERDLIGTWITQGARTN
ncbi:urate hydroxylase PuuD [Pseudomonas sp. D8002]|uniref:Urate hydroxylase PuuD n=1 Tax=Pseudomonas yamanorum TaxID=515393 RepID=A0ABU1CVF8_9PSED|nr:MULTISPECIES: urate hydroxylase PuuD [Pseudomonas]MBK5436465.1 urate hydroxylase PuuD [Pseudomonas sp. TH32]MBT1266653.1 urate hydroxylase PuuD [Pseudomonas sp. VS38]MDP9062942.1 urate hydroxylase PuuD [Pseudomonadota bacterium]NVZ41895.1 urate hydroxylase PuuD [Pseudomonas sp. 21615526]NWA32959.1 urate hydroxylase PuuD [Pseudomonas sp. C6002]NWA92717.1 urate hydroxylase PuuD [Pseudomonas sp. D8002]NWB55346.1 urate hydroxylase PuuD [Pseudomonas sp. F8002]NWB70261.1 urate hydroxylase PuuD